MGAQHQTRGGLNEPNQLHVGESHKSSGSAGKDFDPRWWEESVPS